MSQSQLAIQPPVSWQPLQESLAEFHAEFAGLEQFVDRLLGELDLLRGQLQQKAGELAHERSRSTELAELVAEQRREVAQYQQENKLELQQLRELVERQAELLRDAPPTRPREIAAVETAPEPDVVHASQEVRDPVVSSVVAQFAKLQHDMAQRRKTKTSVN